MNDIVQLERRIYAKISRCTDSGCWIWTGAKSGFHKPGIPRYGSTYFMGKQIRVHRAMYALANGIDARFSGGDVCHSCDNPSCVNPNHLFLASHKDNMLDASEKGRIKNQNTAKTHCKRGHEFSVENTLVGSTGYRECRMCKRAKDAKRRATIKRNEACEQASDWEEVQ